MKRAARLIVTISLVLAASRWRASADKVDPVAKVIEMIDTLSTQLEADGEKEEKAYHAYYEWCDESAHQKKFEIKASLNQKEKLQSTINKATTDSEASTAKIDDMVAKIKTDSDEMRAAAEIREKEKAEFSASEAELMSAGGTLDRAIQVLEREMAKDPAAFAQIAVSAKADGLASALGVVLDAASILTEDKAKLLELVQYAQQEEQDEGADAPAPGAYKSHSGSIVDTLDELKEKAEAQLKEIRKVEASNSQTHALLVQGFKDQVAADMRALADDRTFLSDTSGSKALAEKELVPLLKSLEDTQAALASIQEDCMHAAYDHEVSKKAREEEVKVIAEAKGTLEQSAEGAKEATYSFVQVSFSAKKWNGQERRKRGVARYLKELAKEQRSAALAQLASRISAVVQFDISSSTDPFAKIKGMISEMIAQLQTEAEREAKEKAYCDGEIAETGEKKEQLDSEKFALTAKLDSQVAQSADLKKQIRLLQEQVAALAKERVGIVNVRTEEHAAYQRVKADLEKGILGVRKATKLLRNYYGNRDEEESLLQQQAGQPAKPVSHEPSSGAGSTILSVLEVVESDMARSLAAIESEESNAMQAYGRRLQEINESTALKGKDITYKTQELKSTDGTIDRLSEARGATEEELSAVLKYDDKVKEKCIGKPTSYEHRAARRKAEVTGLQQALDALEGTSQVEFVQIMQSRHRQRLRGELMSSD